MPSEPQTHHPSPPLVAVAAWALPGLGYWLIGHRARAITIGVTVMILFVGGILIAGIRVIDVPGYDDLGQRVMLDKAGNTIPSGIRSDGTWALRKRPFMEVASKPWFVAQVLMGPVTLVSANISLKYAAPPNPGNINSTQRKSHARLWEIGTLYTAIAGMLNLLAIIDSSYRAGRYHPAVEPEPEPTQQGAQ
ncbi:MAG TPA: DUF6677 family protein [Tepidisphaeraceae bacterium]|nr:DUF6677 family protein [Tepidisphaeraceae bacterium]